MIVDKITGTFQTRSDKPNENWEQDNKYFLIEDGSELANKIIGNYPNYTLVVENGRLIDIDVIEVQKEIEITQNEINLDLDFRISCLELGL